MAEIREQTYWLARNVQEADARHIGVDTWRLSFHKHKVKGEDFAAIRARLKAYVEDRWQVWHERSEGIIPPAAVVTIDFRTHNTYKFLWQVEATVHTQEARTDE